MKVKVSQQPQAGSATVNLQGVKEVVAVGIQGPVGPAGPNVITNAVDVDATLLENGSVLVYKIATSKWTSTTTLDSQNMEGGEY